MHENVHVQAVPIAAAVLVATRIGVIVLCVTARIVAPHADSDSEVIDNQARMQTNVFK